MKTNRLLLTGTLLCALLLSLCAASLAWFSNEGLLTPDLGFSAGGPEEYALYEITYSNDEPAQQSVQQTDRVGADFSVSDLQFGTISNLSYLENSNVIYYAIRVPKSLGQTVNLGVSFGDVDEDGQHFKIYVPERQDGEIVRDENDNIVPVLYTDADNLANIQAIETNHDDTFISYSFAISEQAPADFGDIADMNALFADVTVQPMNSVDGNGAPVLTPTVFDTSAVSEDYYYVYIKLQPNIDLYKFFVDYLWDNMPFCLAYEIRVLLTVTP